MRSCFSLSRYYEHKKRGYQKNFLIFHGPRTFLLNKKILNIKIISTSYLETKVVSPPYKISSRKLMLILFCYYVFPYTEIKVILCRFSPSYKHLLIMVSLLFTFISSSTEPIIMFWVQTMFKTFLFKK